MLTLRAILFSLMCLISYSAFSQIRPAETNSGVRPSLDTSLTVKPDTLTRLKPASNSQNKVVKDSARLAIEKMPRQAARRSAMLPGLGQIKNKRWWKLPIIYGGFVGVGFAVDFNQHFYKKFLTELQARDYNLRNKDKPPKPLDPELTGYRDNTGLIQGKDYYRRNRDLSVLGGVALYAVNIIDAYVDAKFFRFDISDELGFKIKPAIIPSVSHAYVSPVPAIKLQIKL